jgi:hypothetical protein
MGQRVAFHFHGYQPGDLVRRIPGSPLEPLQWEERVSPVALLVGDQKVEGKNWTDAMFGCYDLFMDLLNAMGGSLGEGVCSVDIEPFTLEMLLRKDRGEGRDAYGKVVRVFGEAVADPVVTIPFHPPFPYLHPFEQEVLAALAFDFYRPLLPSAPEGGLAATGVWLPEALYTHRAARTVARCHEEAFPRTQRELYFVLDSRQFLDPSPGFRHWSLNHVDLGLPKVAYVFGRDVELSDAFAFGSRSVEEIVDAIVYERSDLLKEERGVPYLLTMASDLEALTGGPRQVERFRRLVEVLREVESPPTTHSKFLLGKLLGGLPAWEGEGTAEAFRAVVKDYSSWSDYFDHVVGGRTGDTRWQGMRRIDGLVISRRLGDRRVSQIWKQALLAVGERVETSIRRAVGVVLRVVARRSTRARARRFLTAYGRTIFREHYLRQGLPPEGCTVAAAVDEHLGGVDDLETLALAARGYYEMLMGLRSDPCFWAAPDTRVTFQSTVLLSHALVDAMEACRRVGEVSTSDRLFRLLRSDLFDFENAYHLYRLGGLSGRRGWETSEEAWVLALQSAVPSRSDYNVVKRAALWAVGRELPAALLQQLPHDPSQVVADVGHIEGEAHGLWAQPSWCEHRGA